MNISAVRWLLGSLCVLHAVALLAPAGVSALYGEMDDVQGFLLSSAVAAAGGTLLMLTNRKSRETSEGRPAFFLREGLVVVGLGWILSAAIGSLPFLWCGATDSVADALFESTSGFTTTGASIFSGDQVDGLSHGIAFWRCFSHWIGGIGIVIVFVSVFPSGGRNLYRAETISREADSARVRDSAFKVMRVYFVLTLLHAVALKLAGLDVFDSVIHAFSSIATGGFSNRGASIAYYASPLVEFVCIVFMVAAGVNFFVWDVFLRRGPGGALEHAQRSTELKLYLLVLGCGCLVITLVLWVWGGSNGLPGSDLPNYSSFLASARDATFSFVSMQTCTGYVTADFDRWPDVCRMLLAAAAFVGACTGSTGGGVKIVRLAVVTRAALAAARSFAQPRSIQTVEMDGKALGDETIASATRFFALWVLLGLGAAVALALLGSDATTSLTSVISCMSNVGPGLGSVGPSLHYGDLNGASKVILCAAMLFGRLELYALIALFLPRTWRR